MIIYAYLDRDYNLSYRSQSYIEVEDLLFWQNNEAIIHQIWKLDTDNDEIMYRFFSGLRKYSITTQVVTDFCRNINYDLDVLKKRYASSLQQG